MDLPALPLNWADLIDPEQDRPSKREQFLSTYQHQSFSLPHDSIMFYILKNPKTPEIYQKMIKCCKYFFIKNPILVVLQLKYRGEHGWYSDYNDYNEKPVIEFKNISSKIWITTEIRISYTFTSMPKVYQNDAKYIFIYNTSICHKDFIFLAGKCQNIKLTYCNVMNDSTTVFLETIVASLPKAESFEYALDILNPPKTITSKTVSELLKIPHFPNLTYFMLDEVPDTFEIETFYEYIKQNKKTEIGLVFDLGISLPNLEYENRLQIIVNDILEAETRDYKVPGIHFESIEPVSLKKLFKLLSFNFEYN
uniref:Uncharacterized protein n=1 Tax=Panagrolaimus davidi TaxID=227884 RepID=A0A914QUQ0_9BILA